MKNISAAKAMELFDKKTIGVELSDGTDLLMAENGYRKEDIPKLLVEGCKFYID